MSKQANDLINESSPYLLQHAYNPVKWNPWNDAVLERAKKEDKMILVSVGYSACHWCHVMERECFEDEQVAALMNDHFICIKVDREERPDIDQVYMLAVQLMTGRGGWPLNCFTLPDGKAVYGGTYFPKQQWVNLLLNLVDLWQHEKDKVYEYADKLMEGMRLSDPVMIDTEGSFKQSDIDKAVGQWYQRCDNVNGGPNHAPKFMLPANYQLLSNYNWYKRDSAIENHIALTLKKMAFGGIYDQIGGGFARYSTDMEWKVPHFEKMLYDNAQLITLYSRSYGIKRNQLYREIVYQTIHFVLTEMRGDQAQFYSALDADSEGEEGKFYVWKKEELQQVLGKDFEIVEKYYNINEKGFWEHGNYILLRDRDDDEIARMLNLSKEELTEKVTAINKKLYEQREKRVRPGLDDKTLCSWNAMMSSSLCDAYKIFGEASFLEAAEKNMNFIIDEMSDGQRLYHSWKNGKATINGFLEDYAFTCQALIDLYECTFLEKYLQLAKAHIEYVNLHFSDEKNTMYWFTSDIDPALVVRKKELTDNVIPSSNSVMAKALFRIGNYFSLDDHIRRAEKMCGKIYSAFLDYPEGYSNWGQLIIQLMHPFYEVAVTGSTAKNAALQLLKAPMPEKVISIGNGESSLPLLADKPASKETRIYVCSNKTCQAPVTETEKALTMLV